MPLWGLTLYRPVTHVCIMVYPCHPPYKPIKINNLILLLLGHFYTESYMVGKGLIICTHSFCCFFNNRPGRHQPIWLRTFSCDSEADASLLDCTSCPAGSYEDYTDDIRCFHDDDITVECGMWLAAGQITLKSPLLITCQVCTFLR